MLLLPLLTVFFPSAFAALTYRGVDWSSLLLVEEAADKTYTGIDGNTKPLEQILKNNGYEPADGDYNLNYNLDLAKRATKLGLDVYLDFHFSNTWADPEHQTTPKAWESYGVDDLATAVQNYTETVMNSFNSADIPIQIVSIGNEITAGLLWPVGDIRTDSGPSNVAKLLHAASAGVKSSYFTPQPKIMIHLDNGWEWSTQQWWYDAVLGESVLTTDDFDMQGVSYYPFYNEEATLDALRTSLTNMKTQYGKDVLVVETNWPQSCPDPEYAFPSDASDIAYTPARQKLWMKNVASAVEDAGGNGVFYWEPAWLDNAALGSSCADNLMFANNGHALKSMEVFGSI